MKRVIIIGATSGIGKALAQIMAAEGYRVGITGRRKENLEALKKSNPAAFVSLSYDCVADDNAEQLTILTEQLGGLDILVMNSGIGHLNRSLDNKLEQETIDLNVSAFTAVMNWGYNYFKIAGGGQLVTISSISGIRGARHAPAYGASKAFQINYMEGLYQKATKEKLAITLTDIRPGFVNTPMAKGEGRFWQAPVEKAAQQIFGQIKNKKRVGYITKRWRLIAWLLKLLPGWIYKRL